LAPGAGRGGGGGGGGGGRIMRSPSAVKQMLLEWCKSKTRGYEVQCVTCDTFGAWPNIITM